MLKISKNDNSVIKDWVKIQKAYVVAIPAENGGMLSEYFKFIKRIF
jgi:hypothetical protein